MTIRTTGERPIQIRAGILDRMDAAATVQLGPGFGIMPEQAPDSPCPTPAEPHWRAAELKQAIAVANEAGLRTYRIEIAPDGTISIIVGDGSEGAVPPSSR